VQACYAVKSWLQFNCQMLESQVLGACHAQAMGLEDYLEVVWPRANVYLGSGADDEKFLTRPYGRVDRPKLKRMLLQRCIDSGVIFHIDKVCLIAALWKPALLLLIILQRCPLQICACSARETLGLTYTTFMHVLQVDSVTHGDGGSTMQCGSGVALRSAAALDATGHALKLVEFDTKFDPGYQVCRQGQPMGHICTGLQLHD
jgi:lycopene beta-cyclase